MRINQPTTPHEYRIPGDATLVSTTDIQGRILHCNRSFIEVSGFDRDELLGQPHNIVRHPDMPEQAFQDMWDTVQRGEPWSGLIKNRRRNGDYYWVRANVTPLMRGDAPVGYMSVRTAPVPHEVERAEALYARMREEAHSGQLVHRLQGGAVRRSGWRGLLGRARATAYEQRLLLPVVGACALSGLIGGWLPAHAAGWAAVAGAALGLVAAAVLRTAVARPLQEVLALSHRLAAGDLSAEPASGRGRDLIGRVFQALGQVTLNLRAAVRDAEDEVQLIRGACAGITAGNGELGERTRSQSGSLERTAASMAQITGTVRDSADAAQAAAERASQAEAVTRRGNADVSRVSQTMEAISDSSRRIAEIIQVIDSIAFQTNILALNAAVEAARAGEQGRGFAVVAAEVRALAQRTSGAAREIKALIESSTQDVRAGAQQVAQARETLDAALASVREVDALIGRISVGAREQLAGISQVNEAVTQLEGINQRNGHMVEQLSGSALALQGQADVVAASVGVFHLGGGAQRMLPDAVALRRAAKEARTTAPPTAG